MTVRRWPAADGLVERVAHDLVEPGLGAVTELVACGEVELEGDAAPHREALGQLADGGGQAEIPQRVRLDAADDLAQVDARLAGHRQRALDDRRAARDVSGCERVLRCVEHLGDRRDELNRAVVDELGQPPALVTLGAEPLCERPAAVVVGQSIIASRNAIATACVRVSASSFVRMWRTWLLTVSCEMNS